MPFGDLPLPLLRAVADFVQADEYVAMVDTCRAWRFLQQLVHPLMDEPSMRLLLILIQEGRNVFLTGRGGTGKSTAMVRIRRLLESIGRPAKWMAPTGKAAIKVEDATTIHSVFVGALGRKTTVKDLGLRSNYRATSKRPARFDKDMQAWGDIETLVIDEVSMVSDEVLRRLYLSAGMCTQGRKACKPMGGRQVILAGDMLQFPPVNAKFPFTTREWDRLNLHIVSLNYSWRHRENTRFDRMLQRIRFGQPITSDLDLLRDMVAEDVADIRQVPHIFPTNVKKDIHNAQMELEPEVEHLAVERIVQVTRKRKTTREETDENDIKTEMVEEETDIPMRDEWRYKVEKACLELEPRAPKLLKLTRGNTYSLVRNVDVSAGLGNGTDMVYDGDGNRFVYQRFGRSHKYRVQQYAWRAKLEQPERNITVFFERKQYMVIPSAGMTIHRAQGTEFDRVHIDFGTGFGGKGERDSAIIYTGLSRGKKRAGTTLESFPDPKRIRAHPEAVKFYERHGLR